MSVKELCSVAAPKILGPGSFIVVNLLLLFLWKVSVLVVLCHLLSNLKFIKLIHTESNSDTEW